MCNKGQLRKKKDELFFSITNVAESGDNADDNLSNDHGRI